jgi:hypothetical protein
MRTVWNTKRLYTEDGQIIVAETQADGTVLFNDVSRMIGGRLKKPTLYRVTETATELRMYVEAAYDRHAYVLDTAALALRPTDKEFAAHSIADKRRGGAR